MKSLRTFAVAAGVSLAVLAGPASAAEERHNVQHDAGVSVTECGKMPLQYLRACKAYTTKSVPALVGYYRFARSGDMLAKPAARRFEFQYRKAVRLQIRSQVSRWTRTVRQVGPVDIVLRSISVDSSDRYAVIKTYQSWLVSDADGRVVYQVNRQKTGILMKNVANNRRGTNHPPVWVVVQYTS